MKEVIGAYNSILKPFRDASLVAQGATYPTLPYVARFLLPIINECRDNLLSTQPTDGVLQTSVKTKMRNKLLYYYTMEVQPLLYLAALLDPLHATKIKSLGCDETTKELALDLLHSRLDEALAADEVRNEAAATEEPELSQNSEESWQARKKLKPSHA